MYFCFSHPILCDMIWKSNKRFAFGFCENSLMALFYNCSQRLKKVVETFVTERVHFILLLCSTIGNKIVKSILKTASKIFGTIFPLWCVYMLKVNKNLQKMIRRIHSIDTVWEVYHIKTAKLQKASAWLFIVTHKTLRPYLQHCTLFLQRVNVLVTVDLPTAIRFNGAQKQTIKKLTAITWALW